MRMQSTLLTLTLSLLTVASLACAAADISQSPRVEVGQAAPAISLAGSDGETYTLSERKAEKDLVVIFFRGTW